MGLKHLNSYMKGKCSSYSIRKIHFKELKGKTIIIDTSIYVYKFLADNYELFENMFHMISLLLQYEITPIFIFDGKPPIEKQELIMKRYDQKKEARDKYFQSIKEQKPKVVIQKYKSKAIFVKDSHIKQVQQMMDAFQVQYYEARSESDPVCSYLVKQNQRWACMSDDMDMFLYNCRYVLRQLDLKHHTVMLYETPKIMEELTISPSLFTRVLLLTGSDYLDNQDIVSMDIAYCWYCDFIASGKNDFYAWLHENRVISSTHKSKLEKLVEMFASERNIANELFEDGFSISTQKPREKLANVKWKLLEEIMGKYGFVFPIKD